MSHASEPWKAWRFGVKDANGGDIAGIWLRPCDPAWDQQANAKRIVECVNACAGMKDPVKEIAKLRGIK